MVDLKVDFCSHKAAKYACENWHYSKCVPKSKLVKLGVWYQQEFAGVVIFGVGANNNLVKPYGLKKQQGCELVRVAFKDHPNFFVSQVLAVAIKKLKTHCPDLRLLISFADTEKNHEGKIYQATNWLYAGMSSPAEEFLIKGKRIHGRSLRNSKPKSMTTKEYAKKLDPSFRIVMGSCKHRYLYPLDRKMARQLQPLALPYPKKRADD